MAFDALRLAALPGSNCSGDAVELTEGSKGGFGLGRFCSLRAVPALLQSALPTVLVHFKTDTTRSAEGFALRVWQVPGVGSIFIFTSDSKEIIAS